VISPRRHSFFCPSSVPDTWCALAGLIKRSVAGASKVQANLLDEKERKYTIAVPLIACPQYDDEKLVGLNSSTPATIGTKSPAKGIHGEIINSTAVFAKPSPDLLFAFGYEMDDLRIPYSLRGNPPRRQEPTQNQHKQDD